MLKAILARLLLVLGILLAAASSARATECPCVAGSAEGCAAQRQAVEDVVSAARPAILGNENPVLEPELRRRALSALAYWRNEVSRHGTARGFNYLASVQCSLGEYVGCAESFQRALVTRPHDECPLGDRSSRTQLNLDQTRSRRLRVHFETIPTNAVLNAAFLDVGDGNESELELHYQPVVDAAEPRTYFLNPGRQRLEFVAPGFEPLSYDFSGAPCESTKGKTCMWPTIHLRPLPREAQSPERPSKVTPARQPPTNESPDNIKDMTPERVRLRTVNPWVVAGTGLAGGLGLVFGVINSREVASKNSELKSMCPNDTCTSDAEVKHYHDLRDEALDARRDATISYVAGSAALVAGVVYVVAQLTTGGSAAEPQAAGSLRVLAHAQPNLGCFELSSDW